MNRAVALALIVWCAGAGCLLVSYSRQSINDLIPGTASASQPSNEMATAPSCHAHRQTQKATASKTAKAAGAITQPISGSSRSGSMSCCPLKTGTMAAASRSQS